MNLLDKNYVMEIISDYDSSQNRERRINEIKAFEVYSGNLKEHVENRIKQLYPKTYSSFSISDLNLSRKINDKLSKAYKKSPIRVLDTDLEGEEYSQALKDANSVAAWQTFDLYFNLHRYACMWFNYYEDVMGEMNIVLRPLAPFQFARVVDKYNRTKVFIVNFPDNDLYETTDTDGRRSIIQDSPQDTKCKRYALWSDTQHVVIRYYEASGKEPQCRIEYEDIDGNPDNINPLGIIPAVFAQQGDNAALPILNPITSQVIEYNQQYSVMLTGNSLQTFGHLVLKHPEDQKMPDEIYNSLFTYSRLPQRQDSPETTLDYLNPNPNIQSGLDLLANYAHQIVTEHLGDGSQNVKGSENFTSGLDRMIAQSDITNIIESNQQVYANCENDLYWIIRAFYESRNDFRFKSNGITVKYTKAKPIQSEAEILANIDKKKQLGLIEDWEALIELDPNMSEQAAKDKIDRIKKEKKDNMQSFFNQGVDLSGNQHNEEN